MTSLWSKLVSRALRRRVYSATATSTQLARTLGTLDLTMLGMALRGPLSVYFTKVIIVFLFA